MMDYEMFKKEVEKLSGINLSFYKEKQMKRRIEALIKKNNYPSFDQYIVAIKENKQLYNEFINYLTINVSEFYRNPDQWEILLKDVFPVLLQKSQELKIWSSACSTGDEPYTLAMVLNRLVPLKNIKIIATDIDDEAIRKAKAGKYIAKSLESLPEDFKTKHFIQNSDSTYSVSEEIKNCVEFRKMNLLKDSYPKEMDLIVCRNVLIYFTDEAKDMIYQKFSDSLRKGGMLFVGSTEQIIVPKKYSLKTFKTFYYEKEVALQIETTAGIPAAVSGS